MAGLLCLLSLPSSFTWQMKVFFMLDETGDRSSSSLTSSYFLGDLFLFIVILSVVVVLRLI